MKFGINTFLFTSPFTTKSIALFPDFKRWGFDSVEIALENASDIDAQTIKKALGDNGLVCGSVCGAFGPDRDLRGTISGQRTSLDYQKMVMDSMAEIGCPILAGPLYSAVGRAEATSEDDYRKQWDTVVTHLRTLSDYAASLNIKLAIEPLNRYETDFINTCGQGLKMVGDVGSESIGLLLDSYHMNIEEKNSAQAILQAGKKLFHFHACGCDRGTPGGDHINWPAIVAAIDNVGYDGGVVIESFTTDVKVIAKAASIWRKLEKSQEAIAVDGVQFLRSQFNR
jgi:D-psicose/D-tagatose/L-ribulose 3-epimerase